jgi:hypothetical protein
MAENPGKKTHYFEYSLVLFDNFVKNRTDTYNVEVLSLSSSVLRIILIGLPARNDVISFFRHSNCRRAVVDC